ncbi:MAG: hypothetical protein M3Y83_14465 [Actinomycetota bacterium]|nr:hypothetical protein [Actinomycetota bacterium]
MSTGLMPAAYTAPQWAGIAGVGVAAWLVLAWAILARRQPASPIRGRHRLDRIATPDVFDRVLAGNGVGGPLPLLPFAPGTDYRDDVDDWTADLPTMQFLPGFDWADLYDDVSLAAIRFAAELRHTSPSDVVRGRCEVDTPIFAALAKELGYDPVRGFDIGLVAA